MNAASSATPPGFGSATRWMWASRSKSDAGTHRGVSNGTGDSRTTWRRRGCLAMRRPSITFRRSMSRGASRIASDVTTKWFVGDSACSHATSARDSASPVNTAISSPKRLPAPAARTGPIGTIRKGLEVLITSAGQQYGRDVQAQRAFERPAAVEAAFLALEQKRVPMHVGAIVIFDGRRPLTMAELRTHVRERARKLERFHQRLRRSAGGWAWVPAGRIDLSAHVFRHELPAPGTDDQLRELCGRLHEQRLDRDRPLWEMHLIDGLAGGRQALVIKTHHAITDGLAGLAVAEVLFDMAPGVEKPRTLPVMGFAPRVLDTAVATVHGLEGLAVVAAGGPLAAAGPFNAAVSPHRSLGMAALPVTEVKRIKRALGVSVDDVLVGAVSVGLGTYLRRRGYISEAATLRAMLPVSTRGAHCGLALGNHVSSIFVDLPVGMHDFASAVRRVSWSKATLRTTHAADGGALAIEATRLLPAPLEGPLLRLLSRLPFAHLIVSDVPGPEQPMFLRGRRIIGSFPMMPLAADIGLSIAMLTIGPSIGLGVTSDPKIVSEPQVLADDISGALAGAVSLRLAG